MRNIKILLSIISLLLFFTVVYCKPIEITHKYVLPQFSVPINIESKSVFNAGETLEANIRIQYFYPYYFPDAKLVVQLVKSNSSNLYPSDLYDYNVILEKVYNLSLEPGNTYVIKFVYNIPKDIEGGKYFIVTYLYTPLTYISGLPFIFLPGSYKEIRINGNGSFPYVRISHRLTTINDKSPTIGAGSADKIRIRIALISKINTDAKLVIKYAKWDDITRKNYILYESSIKLVKGVNYIEIQKNINNLKSNVYAIRVEVYVNNTLQSMYRLRFIKVGPTAELRGILLSEDGNLTIIVGPSPDHYNYPTTEDVSLLITSKELNYNTKVYLGDINYFSSGFTYIKTKLNLTKKEFTLCATLFFKDKVVDSYCVRYSMKTKEPIILLNGSKLYINSPVSGKLIIEDVNRGSEMIYKIAKGENVFFLKDGKYNIYFMSGNINMEREIEVKQAVSNRSNILSSAKKVLTNPNILNKLVIVGLILILLIIFYMIARLLGRGRKELIYLFALILITTSLHPIYATVNISSNTICSIQGKLNITAISNETPYNLSIYVYSNGTLVYGPFEKECTSETCSYTLIISKLSPGKNYTLRVVLTRRFFKRFPIEPTSRIFPPLLAQGVIEEDNFTLEAVYPYSISLIDSKIYEGSYVGVKIAPVKECMSIKGYNKTVFNITFDNEILREGCLYSGDLEWGSNICGVDTSKLESGIYALYAKYMLAGVNFTQYIGDLQILPVTTYTFNNNRCRHGWSLRGIGPEYHISIVGEHASDNGILVLAPGSDFKITNIESLNYLCSNGHTGPNVARIAAFVYKSLINKPTSNYSLEEFIQGRDNMGNVYSKNMGNIMENIYNKYTNKGLVLSNFNNPSSEFDVYTFKNPGYYTIFINKINAYCNSPTSYVCPSTRSSNNLCNIGQWTGKPSDYVGWMLLGNISILVPDPEVEGTFIENLTIYPYFNKTFGKWYAFVYNYSIGIYKGRLNIFVPKQVPLEAIKIGKFKNIGYGKVKVGAFLTGKNTSINISEDKESVLFLNILNDVLEKCKNKDCTIKYSIYYDDAYGFSAYPKKTIADPYINVKWVKLRAEVEPGYLDGIVTIIRVNVTNENTLIEAQDVGLNSANYDSSCIKILRYPKVSIPPGDTKTIEVPILLLKTSCPLDSYNVTLTFSGINTEKEVLKINVIKYIRNSIKLYTSKRKLIVGEKLNMLLLLALVALLTLL